MRRGLLAAGAGLLALHQYDTHFCHERINRNARTLWAALATVYDYKIDLDRRPEALSEIHSRVAHRWYNLCAVNGGLYIKLGQSISMMNHVLPPEYASLFANLQDKAPMVSYEEVCRVFKEDFGGKVPADLFGTFDPVPVASASIAQVHRATLKDGTAVAVKVQKPAIRDQMPWDLSCYRILVFAFDRIFQLPFYWTVDTVCESVTKEADFRIEEEHTIRAKRDLEGQVPNVYVPKVMAGYTTGRVMVLEWIDGVKLSRSEEIRSMGFQLKDVLTTLTRAMAHEIFVSGFVHGDPHPGNVFVRRNPQQPSQHQVCLIDFGLVVDCSEKFRIEYCQLWKAMVLTDFEALKRVCSQWGISDPELFASIQLFRPFKKGRPAGHGLRTTKGELLELQAQAKERVRSLLANTHQVPLELIIMGRTLNILRGNNKHAGVDAANRIRIFGEYAAKGTNAVSFKENGRQAIVIVRRLPPILTMAGVSSRVDVGLFHLRLLVIEFLFQASQAWRRAMQWVTRRDVGGLEEALEKNVSRQVEDKLGFRVGYTDPNLG